jgi:prepilin peptidase CpaA
VLAVVVVGLGTGALVDLKTRRVPNILTLTLAATGVASAATGLSGLSVKASLLGLALGLLFMLPGHMIGATGAGDVKLFAGAGALIGPSHIAMAFFYTAVAGGALALLVAFRRRRVGLTLDRTRELVVTRANVSDIEHPRANNRFAYAPAIAIGGMLAALGM